ncbi:hypothetical protein [Streptomyces sp. NPDC059916]|uniref:hypothetical protein n=1 Tax=Streptomyces sp. NPDC059916 TaxID=3347001 RepID=UPI0036A1C8E6
MTSKDGRRPRPRGECPKCSPRRFQLTRKGVLAWQYGISAAGFSTGGRCDGVGEKPFVPKGA